MSRFIIDLVQGFSHAITAPPSPTFTLRKLENQEAGDYSVQAQKTKNHDSGVQGWEEMGVLGKYLGKKKNSEIVMNVCDSLESSVTVSSAVTFNYLMIKLTCIQLT